MASMHTKFFLEALKITSFCLLVTGLFKFIGASQGTLLVMFTMAVMISAATFSPEKKKSHQLLIAGVAMGLTILLSGVVGFYAPILSKFLVILYAVIAFGLPRTRFYQLMMITCSVMALIFTSLPFDLHQAIGYLPYAVVLIISLTFFYTLFDKGIYKSDEHLTLSLADKRLAMATVAGMALFLALIVELLLHHFTHMTHLYWVGLTVLVVIQNSADKTIKTTLQRITVNIVGALFIVGLMGYVVPPGFGINFALMSVFLFCIFAFGYSYIFRTLFIEMFVLGITHLLGDFHTAIALDRIVLTLIGGLLVIIAVLLFSILKRRMSPNIN